MTNPSRNSYSPSTQKPSITHIIFVMDGLLLDTEKFDNEVLEIILARYNKTFDMSLMAKLMGARRLIRHLHAKGIPMCVVTCNPKRHFQLKTQQHGEIFSLMHHIVLGDDPEVKPWELSPDIFLTAANRFEVGPVVLRKVLVFDHRRSGVPAAKNAGMSVVMVPHPSRLDSSYHGIADQVLSSLLDFNPSDWGLPPFDDSST